MIVSGLRGGDVEGSASLVMLKVKVKKVHKRGPAQMWNSTGDTSMFG